jgi:hypothetical protein
LILRCFTLKQEADLLNMVLFIGVGTIVQWQS